MTGSDRRHSACKTWETLKHGGHRFSGVGIPCGYGVCVRQNSFQDPVIRDELEPSKHEEFHGYPRNGPRHEVARSGLLSSGIADGVQIVVYTGFRRHRKCTGKVLRTVVSTVPGVVLNNPFHIMRRTAFIRRYVAEEHLPHRWRLGHGDGSTKTATGQHEGCDRNKEPCEFQ